MTTIANVSPAVSPCFVKVKVWITLDPSCKLIGAPDFSAIETPQCRCEKCDRMLFKSDDRRFYRLCENCANKE